MSSSSKYLAAREIYRKLLAEKGAKKEPSQSDPPEVALESAIPNSSRASERERSDTISDVPTLDTSTGAGETGPADVEIQNPFRAPSGRSREPVATASKPSPLGKHERGEAPDSEVKSRRVKHKSSRVCSATEGVPQDDVDNVKLVLFPSDTSVETHQELLCEVAEQLCFENDSEELWKLTPLQFYRAAVAHEFKVSSGSFSARFFVVSFLFSYCLKFA